MPRDTYTHGHPGVVVRSHAARTAEDSCAYLLDRLTPGTSLLDVGCGPGSITADLAERVAPGRVRGVEVVPGPLEQARAGAAARGLKVEFAVDDGYALSDPDGTWDVVHAHQVLQHVSDPVAVLREMGRVARPGGLVAARDADYAGFHWWPHDPRLDRWLGLDRAVARGLERSSLRDSNRSWAALVRRAMSARATLLHTNAVVTLTRMTTPSPTPDDGCSAGRTRPDSPR